MTLSDEQQAIADSIIRMEFPVTIVSGFAGTGKSVLIKYLKENMYNVLLACYSGIAADNIDGVTTFALCGIPTHYPLNPNNKCAKSARIKDPYAKHFNRRDKKLKYPDPDAYEPIKYKPLRAARILILDEADALRCDHVDFIDKTLRQARRCQEPFGGLQIVFVGDPGQAQPIVGKDQKKLEEWGYKYPFNFREARVVREML